MLNIMYSIPTQNNILIIETPNVNIFRIYSENSQSGFRLFLNLARKI